ncbi:MAG: ribosome silencing factor [Lachnospiraceae bacterium]|nr:ribosome silencing factor [Lachnospiraceae bacterium]
MEKEMIKEKAIELSHILDSKKGETIELLDIGGISPIADYFVLASASNQNQLAAMQDAVDEYMSKQKINARSIEGNKNSTWILMDYEDIVVHLFTKEDRDFYDLDRIWKDGEKIDWNK